MILNKQIGVYLNQVHCHFKQFVYKSFQANGFDLTPEQFLVMDTLWDEGILNQQQIADCIKKDKNSVTKLIDGLEKRGLVMRVAAGSDRRAKHIVVTRSAEMIKDKIVALAIEAVDKICRDIPETDLTVFITVLERMSKNCLYYDL